MHIMRTRFGLLLTVGTVALGSSTVHGQYLKIDPPPDSNKPGTATDISCWLHAAANMLAGAGYGTGVDVQTRADEIFNELNASPELATFG